MSNYRKYDDQIKEMVIKSNNPYLFPELKIPRTTALYWIRKSKKKIRLEELNYNDALIDKIKKLETELKNEKLKNLFSTEVSRILSKDKHLSLRNNKKDVVEAIIKYNDVLSISEMCRLIGMGINSFYRYKIDVFGCEKVGYKKCKILAPNQLTFLEQEKIYNLVRDKTLKYLSIKGLQYYAFREGILSCSYESWRKYVKEFRGDSGNRRKKKVKVGIRAQRPNEIWHIDITEFRLKGGDKVYLQAIMDNYSRKIINWKISRNKKAALSILTITEALSSSHPETLMSDGGGENISHHVRLLLSGRGISSLIAKKDTPFSNSMIEGFFNMLKNRFLEKFKNYKISKLYNTILSSVEDFNNTPSAVLNGAKPSEIYMNSINQDELILEFAESKKRAKSIRPVVNKKCLRQICYSSCVE